jgi:hypothetical protein
MSVGLIAAKGVSVNIFPDFVVSHALCFVAKTGPHIVQFMGLPLFDHLVLFAALQKWSSVKISKLDILVTSFHLLYMIIFHWP